MCFFLMYALSDPNKNSIAKWNYKQHNSLYALLIAVMKISANDFKKQPSNL